MMSAIILYNYLLCRSKGIDNLNKKKLINKAAICSENKNEDT